MTVEEALAASVVEPVNDIFEIDPETRVITVPASEKLFEGKTDAQVYRMTFEESLEDIRHFHDFDVMGHLDYVQKS